jgi:hypothetical protein
MRIALTLPVVFLTSCCVLSGKPPEGVGRLKPPMIAFTVRAVWHGAEKRTTRCTATAVARDSRRVKFITAAFCVDDDSTSVPAVSLDMPLVADKEKFRKVPARVVASCGTLALLEADVPADAVLPDAAVLAARMPTIDERSDERPEILAIIALEGGIVNARGRLLTNAGSSTVGIGMGDIAGSLVAYAEMPSPPGSAGAPVLSGDGKTIAFIVARTWKTREGVEFGQAMLLPAYYAARLKGAPPLR